MWRNHGGLWTPLNRHKGDRSMHWFVTIHRILQYYFHFMNRKGRLLRADCLEPSRRSTGRIRARIGLLKKWVGSSWNVIANGDAREGKWRGNLRMEWVASTLHTTSEHGVSSITTVDTHTSAVSTRLNWRPWRFKWTRPFRRSTKSGCSTFAITFQLASSRGVSWVVEGMVAGA